MGNETEPRGRKIPKPVTAQRLQARALAYLSRYASSSENLRRVLERAVRRAACHHETDRAAAAETITGLIAKFERAGILDDNAYAEARVRSLHRGGASRAKIAAQMAQKGVPREAVERAMSALEKERPGADLDLDAAWRYAKRRRFGPYRDPDRRAERRERDLAAMARTGFSVAVALKVIDADRPD
ncbi:MAG: RecX family transcriptional regulator [Alphaproteobacteria bacterium]|nr:RecX family transcriptional regulator [Alphaproteobacteria bacterium]